MTRRQIQVYSYLFELECAIIMLMDYNHSHLAPLPPKIDLSDAVDLLLSAHEAVGRYDEAAKRFINPRLVEGALLTEEARASSTIEGTEISLAEILEHDARQDNQLQEKSTLEKDYREVRNYRLAILEGETLLNPGQSLDASLLKRLHATLLDSVRGHNKMPGAFREHTVYIGKPGHTIAEAKYIPPGHNAIPELVDNMLDYINNYKHHSALIKAAVFHYQFEAIHPFLDGNGRLGRILIPLYLYRESLIAKPNLYLSGFFEKYRREYSDCLHRVDTDNDWKEWLEFFLRGVRYQARRHILRMDQIEHFYDQQYPVVTKLNSRHAQDVFNLLFQRPILSVGTVVTMTGIKQYQTASNLINKLVKVGLLKKIPGRVDRSQLYAYQELLNILEKEVDEPTEPPPSFGF